MTSVCISPYVPVKTCDSHHSTVTSSKQRRQQRRESCKTWDEIKEVHSTPTLASTLSSSLVICVCSKMVVFCSTLASSAVQNVAHECLQNADDKTHWVSESALRNSYDHEGPDLPVPLLAGPYESRGQTRCFLGSVSSLARTPAGTLLCSRQSSCCHEVWYQNGVGQSNTVGQPTRQQT